MNVYPRNKQSASGKIIDELIESDFYSAIKRELDLVDLGYGFKMHPFRLIKDFPEPKFKASAVPNEDQSQIEVVAFFTESISDDINKRFSRVMISSMFFEMARVYVKFVLIHELVHVQQIKYGMSVDEYLRTEYEDSMAEKAANEKAVEVLGRDGEFHGEVAQMIADKRGIEDNIMAEEFRSRFLPFFQ